MQFRLVYIYCCVGILLMACNNVDRKRDDLDSPEKGTIYISVDESFKPVIQEQIKIYQSSFPNTKIIASYKPEVDCFRDLQKDTTRMIVVARGLNNQEREAYFNNLQYRPHYDIIAYDAVAVIINQESIDSLYTFNQLKDILAGKKNITAIMDGNNATSTVRFLQDSLLHGQAFGNNVVAAEGSQAVIDAVSARRDAIGFVGLSWVGNTYETKQIEQLKKIKFALVECTKCDEKGLFAKPSQATITYGQYPLARPLYFILKENYTGLGTAFKNFMMLERGQLIFRRALLAPAKMDFSKRNGNISEEK